MELISSGIIEFKHIESETLLTSEVYFEPIDEKNNKLSLVPLIKNGEDKVVLTDLKMDLSLPE